MPNLNLKSTEETHSDFDKLKSKRKKTEDFDSYYFNVVEEFSKKFKLNKYR